MIWKLIPKFRKTKTGTSYELLDAVIRAISAEHRRIYMPNWVEMVERVSDWAPACGVIGCIAGWMHLLTAPWAAAICGWSAEDYAFSMLPASVHQDAYSLFHGSGGTVTKQGTLVHPYPFPPSGIDRGTARGRREYAQLVIKNIRAFMKRHKAALKAHVIVRNDVYRAAMPDQAGTR